MNEENKEKMLNLLADRAIFGLSEKETAEFARLATEFPALAEDNSFEIAAAAFGLVNLEAAQSLPLHLNSKILSNAENFFAAHKGATEQQQKTLTLPPPKRSIWNSLGWAAAALACVALLVNIWLTRVQPPTEIGRVTPSPTVLPTPETNPSVQREQLLASANDVVEKKWTDFDPKKPRGIAGDIVWSNSRQKGFARFHNLPVNDKTKETYQIWIFDATRNEKTPVSAGVFDVDQNGDVIVPIDAELKIREPKMFAVTAENPGGVVVSKLGKVMSVAKVET